MRVIALCFALLVGGCATFANPVSTNQLATVESAYGIALSVAVGYRNACAQKIIPDTCRPIVVRMQTAGKIAQTQVVTARNFVRNNPTLDAGSLISAARIAVQSLQDIQIKYGVR